MKFTFRITWAWEEVVTQLPVPASHHQVLLKIIGGQKLAKTA